MDVHQITKCKEERPETTSQALVQHISHRLTPLVHNILPCHKMLKIASFQKDWNVVKKPEHSV